MTHTIRKWIWAWDFDKEEVWLNGMSQKGLHLIDVGFCRYTFQEGQPGEYIYRLQLLDNLHSDARSAEYIRFVEETGAEDVGHYLRWVYFRRKSELGEFELFSDLPSRIQHLVKIRLLLLAGSCGLWCNIGNVINGISRGSALMIVLACLYLLLGVCFVRGMLHLTRRIRALRAEQLTRE